ncbi:O-antigen ligase family protein [Bradyrhizobium sp. 4]|uniref:O-antigen ligase family protein n=1 Tax=unclassified Bradyrhizobium TaxID=2631580 RepID=UPI001FF735DF|nr:MULTISPECIES: O-antigen ligase family protein [unclassified Bradyrhizobium]MCK1403798.1 O-antigen ligase family protein [Bradyrhizobium sp. 39]UPJ37855.1 O-antigen ligase family protein [Bradyrhizobium sp. 4]
MSSAFEVFALSRKSFELDSDFQRTYLQDRQQSAVWRAAGGSPSRAELYLKLLLVTIFLPEGLSFFVGDFRLTVARVLIFVFSIAAISWLSQRNPRASVCVPSDIFAPVAGVWMMLAATVTDGSTGLKGAGIEAISFTGAYLSFRYLLGPVDSSVRIARFSSKLIILIVGVALLDSLTDRLFTYDFIKGITGYVKPSYEGAFALKSETLFRDGVIRAMGPMEHSILFGAVCVWFGSLALTTFRPQVFGWGVAGIALVGVLASQARSPLLAYVIGFALAIFYAATPRFRTRWKLVGVAVTCVLVTVFTFSGNPVVTLVRLGGVSPEAAWYRQAIWETGGPVVLGSPIFGIGLNGDWNWQSHGALVSGSVDAFWLAVAMNYGIPGSALILLTIVGACGLGSIDRSPHLTPEEGRLSVALGIVIVAIVFLGFMVHFWGICFILIAVFAGMRANLAETAVLRDRAARVAETGHDSITGGVLLQGGDAHATQRRSHVLG